MQLYKKNLLWEKVIKDFNKLLRNIKRNQQSRKYNNINEERHFVDITSIQDNLTIKEKSKIKTFHYLKQTNDFNE